ncbi:MAG: BrnT family toxin [Phycisphaerae bacterium]
MTFEWDPDKEAENQKKQGISFEEAMTAFEDVSSLIFYDPDHSVEEDRYLLLGLSVRWKLFVIAFTDREHRIRIISARKATSKERKFYEEKITRRPSFGI